MPDEPVERFPEGPSDDEIADRLRRVREELSQMEGLPELPEDRIPEFRPAPTLPEAPDFDDRLRDLEARAQASKDRREAKAATERRQIARDAESNRGLGMGMTVAYTIIGVPLFAIAIGWVLDQRMGTNIYRGMGALIGSIVGIIGAIVLLNRHQQRHP
jgi:F0F1-type ATP synthase assembly protein I